MTKKGAAAARSARSRGYQIAKNTSPSGGTGNIKIELLLTALRMAQHTRTVQPGLIHHSEQSVQYAAADYVAVLHRHILPPVEFEASLTQLTFRSFSGVRYTGHTLSSG